MTKKRPMIKHKRVNRVFTAADAIAQRRFDDRLEMSTTFTLAAMILAMDKAHCKINYDKWFDLFKDIYPEVLADPDPHIKQAGEIVDADIEIHFTE